ncbi:MAG TPA: DNA mismatch repair endonuclease MutL [Candidatus Dormibacteraeota bacterium]
MTIRVLPPEVADAIAAGEVIERPASVVKELIENSLDAGARRISIELRGAGRTLIRVADDGRGIPREELALAFRRHATSKVQRLADLAAISTLGFRGEALASIAAVAEVECRSGGGRILIRTGAVLEDGAGPPAPGTLTEVRDLFVNTPARLKFMKTDATETASAVHLIRAYAVLHPGVRWELRIDGRTSLATSGDGDRRRALGAVYGSSVEAALVEIEAEGVSGAISQSHLHRGNRDAIVLAVNGRPIASRSLQYALEEAYLGSLERGRYPVAALDLAVDPDQVDVNVHPAKREVRFRDERAVFATLQRTVRAALAGSRPAVISIEAALRVEAPPLRQLAVRAPVPQLAAATAEPAAAEMPLRPLGQVLDGYLVAEGPEGLVLVDQHAAHERILYNRFLARLRGAPAVSQPLLIGMVVEVEPAQAAAAADHRTELCNLGFDLEEFGHRSVRVLAAPIELPAGRVEAALLELLEVLAGGRADDRVERVAAAAACHSAVRFGDPLDLSEQRRLLEELEREPNAQTCPHGRPTRLFLSVEELRRHFRRNY